MNLKNQKLETKDIVEFLFKEKDTARQEVLVNVKIVSQVSMILLPFFFAGIGLLVRFSEDGSDKKIFGSEKLSLLLILINQILFLLWMYGLSVVSNLAALAGYIMALEEKINYFSNEKICLWESIIQPRYTLKWTSGQFISTVLWNFLYLALFIYITIYTYSYCSKQNWSFFIINCSEILVIIIIFWLIRNTRKRSYELTKIKHD
jgi:hypothetical protein